MCDYIRVRNWEKYQQYKDRDPKWIKLHRDLLCDYEFGKLSDSARGQIMLIWLLAAKLDNKIPCDAEWIKKQIGASSEINLDAFFELKYLEKIPLYETVQDCTEVYETVPRGRDRGRDREEEEQEKEGESERENGAGAPVLPFSEKQPPSPKQKPPKQDVSPIADEITTAWNAMAETANKAGYRIPKIATWDEKRKTALRERMKDAFFRGNWKSAIELIPRTPFLRGQNQRGWIANISWFLRPDAVPKTMERAFGPITDGIELLEDIF